MVREQREKSLSKRGDGGHPTVGIGAKGSMADPQRRRRKDKFVKPVRPRTRKGEGANASKVVPSAFSGWGGGTRERGKRRSHRGGVQEGKEGLRGGGFGGSVSFASTKEHHFGNGHRLSETKTGGGK